MQKPKQQVSEAGMDLPRYGLVTFTWSDVSVISRERGMIVIRSNDVDYQTVVIDDTVVADLHGNVVEERYRPSSDTAIHLTLYCHYSSPGGVVHTHPTHTTAWVQAGLAIPTLGTTHADYFFGGIPRTRASTEVEVRDEYELNTGRVIVETLGEVKPLYTPDVVVYQYGPFAWGRDAHGAVHNAVVMEEAAKMAWIMCDINPALNAINSHPMNKYFMHKRSPDACYGQKQE